MRINRTAMPDEMILENIRNNNLQGWEELYDSYSVAMLSLICKLTGDQNKGEEILVKIFTEKKFEDLLNVVRSKLGFHVCSFAFSFAARTLRKEGLEPDENILAGLPRLLRSLYERSANEIVNTEIFSNPLPPKVYRYQWLPIFGVNLYAAN